MPSELDFTGERFVPGVPGEIVYEHVHRYAFARRFAAGRRVLDAACGEGYGSALLAQEAAQVVGVDVDGATIAHARDRYGNVANLRFEQGSVTSLPLASATVDLVVSFETVEHIDREAQSAMLAEFARVLTPEGLLVMSSPNRVEYSDRRGYRNPFHVHELDRDELAALLGPRFRGQRWYGQRIWLGSVLRGEGTASDVEVLEGDTSGAAASAGRAAMYFIVVAGADERHLPGSLPSVSLFADREETELARHETQAREALRLDGLAGERLAALDRQKAHIEHLERLIAELRGEIARSVERNESLEQARSSALAAVDEAKQECDRLQRALDAQERIIAHRQGLRWWLALPWLRAKLAWTQWRSR